MRLKAYLKYNQGTALTEKHSCSAASVRGSVFAGITPCSYQYHFISRFFEKNQHLIPTTTINSTPAVVSRPTSTSHSSYKAMLLYLTHHDSKGHPPLQSRSPKCSFIPTIYCGQVGGFLKASLEVTHLLRKTPWNQQSLLTFTRWFISEALTESSSQRDHGNPAPLAVSFFL